MGVNKKNYTREFANDYCVLDLETTGFSYRYDNILEIGIIRVRNNEIVDSYSQLINPQFHIPKVIEQLTGITNEMIIDKPLINEVKETVLNFIGSDLIVGHNVSFDINFIQENFGVILENKYTDTLQFSKKLYPKLEHHRLSDMVSFLNLSNNEHRALSDCISTKELYDEIRKKMRTENIEIKDIFYKGHTKIDISSISPNSDMIDEDNFFYNKHCVFTGTLEKMIRKEAMQLVVNIGGILDNSVTKKTNYLILGNNDYCKSIKDGKSAKHKKAEKLKLDGQDIEIIDEHTFYELILEEN